MSKGMRLQAYCLVGPTAVGKTSVAQHIAEQGGQAILSADSMLVYKGMDVGTAKPTMEERASVRYFGIDLVEPDREFSVFDYVAHVHDEGDDLSGCILAGGTGLYVQALLCGLSDVPGSDPELRKAWEEAVEKEGVAPLQEELRARFPEAYESLEDKQNPRRLIRALEIAEGGSALPKDEWQESAERIPGIRMEPAALLERIEARVDAMYEGGVIEEVRGLLDRYGDLSSTARQAIGYSETIDLINGKCSLEDAKQGVVKRTRQLAKRQMTWFRNRMNVDWLDIRPGMEVAEIAELVRERWENNCPAEIMMR